MRIRQEDYNLAVVSFRWFMPVFDSCQVILDCAKANFQAVVDELGDAGILSEHEKQELIQDLLITVFVFKNWYQYKGD